MAEIQTPKQHLITMLKTFDTAMLVTHGENGQHRARPMGIAEIKENGQLLFVTRIDSTKVDELKDHSNVCITMQGKMQFISLSGTAMMQRDRALIDKLWKESWRTWFPEGKSDPTISFISVTPSMGEFWDNAGTKGLRYIFEAAKAYATGTTPKIDPEQTGKVSL